MAQPCAAQLAYSIVSRSPVEDEAMVAALGECGASIVASAVLAGGVLTGKYATPGASGRLADQRDQPGKQPVFEAGERLRSLADGMGTTPSRLAIAFALSNSRVASALFGATSPEQVGDNMGVLDVLGEMSDLDLARLREIRTAAAQ